MKKDVDLALRIRGDKNRDNRCEDMGKLNVDYFQIPIGRKFNE